MPAKNLNEFYALFKPAITKATQYVMEKMLEEYKMEIDDVIYGNYVPTVYQRTGEFRDSWVTEVSSQSMGAQGELKQDTSKMTVDLENFQHGSPYSGSVVEALAEIIYEGLSGPLFGEGPWRNPRNPFVILLAKLDSGKISQWFKEGMTQQGIRMK